MLGVVLNVHIIIDNLRFHILSENLKEVTSQMLKFNYVQQASGRKGAILALYVRI